MAKVFLLLLIFLSRASATWDYNHVAYTISEGDQRPGLTAHVQNWATLVQNYILQLASDGLRTEHTQSFYDLATYTLEHKDGRETIEHVRRNLGNYFSSKQRAAQELADEIVRLHDDFVTNPPPEYKKYMKKGMLLSDIPLQYYKDADIPERLPDKLVFHPYFKQKVSNESSVVKISDEVSREQPSLINSTLYSYGLEELFIKNFKSDSQLR